LGEELRINLFGAILLRFFFFGLFFRFGLLVSSFFGFLLLFFLFLLFWLFFLLLGRLRLGLLGLDRLGLLGFACSWLDFAASVGFESGNQRVEEVECFLEMIHL
jgi:hypothetical protein